MVYLKIVNEFLFNTIIVNFECKFTKYIKLGF